MQDVSSDLEIKSPRVRLVIDRDKAAAMALDPAAIIERSTAGSARAGPRRSTATKRSTACCSSSIRSTRRRSARWATWRSRHRAARWCRSSRWCSTTEDVSPQTVNHSGQLPAVAISFGLRPGVALGDAVDAIRALADDAAAGDDDRRVRGLGQGVRGVGDATSACCCSSRSASSTSCSACSTRATSTR